jgi:PAS domain-containing protein
LSLVEPIVVKHSWPLTEQPRQFELGHVLNCAVTDLLSPAAVGAVGLHHAGCWECDLSTSSLTWSGGVYDIFGLPRGATVSRAESLACYCPESMAKMERLRDYSIRHRRGFTLDVEIRPVVGQGRWMRLIAAPVCAGSRPVRLHGLKLAI